MVLGTLCWRCKHATRNLKDEARCPWAWDFRPVDGWEADTLPVSRWGRTETESYRVNKCPLYESDGGKRYEKRSADEARYEQLAKMGLNPSKARRTTAVLCKYLKHGLLPKIRKSAGKGSPSCRVCKHYRRVEDASYVYYSSGICTYKGRNESTSGCMYCVAFEVDV